MPNQIDHEQNIEDFILLGVKINKYFLNHKDKIKTGIIKNGHDEHFPPSRTDWLIRTV